MAQPKEYSSIPIALVIASVILISAVSGWFLFRDYSSTQASGGEAAEPIQLASLSSQSVAAVSQHEIDADLRKARLAADAGLIASPAERNALYFYGRILGVDSGHRLANAEVSFLLARVEQMVNDHLAIGNYDDAYLLAAHVTAQGIDHTIIGSIRTALTDFASDMALSAKELAERGDDAQAMEVLASLDQLAGLSPDFRAATRRSVIAIQRARNEAEQSRLEDERIAANEQEVLEWETAVRDAIAAGQLINPEGDSARDYLEARESPAKTRKQLTGELLAALVDASQQSLESGDLADAESYLSVAHELGAEGVAIPGGGDISIVALLDSVEGELIAAEANKVLGLSDFVHVNVAPPVYPRRAEIRDVSGWVELEFTVTANGETADIEVLRANPRKIFDKSAVEAVQQWTFEPRVYRGQPIDQRSAARLVFQFDQ